MSFETPKYASVPIGEFRQAMVDIRMYNAVSDMLDKFNFNQENGLRKIVYDVANEVMLESKLNYVPVRTGRLRASGYPEMAGETGNTYFVDFGYHAPYAKVVHETHPTKSKYLEKPLDDVVESGVMEERISRAFLKLMGLD